MANKRDYYEVLGVNKTASQDELKKAYRKLSMQYHPDRQAGKSDADKKITEDKFKEVSEAYNILSDKDKRAQYDQFGFDGPQMSSGGFGGFDPFEMFRRHFGEDNDFEFGGFGFGGGSRRQKSNQPPDFNYPENGDDLQMTMKLSFVESIYGCVKDIDLTLTDPCPSCHGKGIENGSTPTTCSACNGTGHHVSIQRNGFMVSQTITTCPSCNGSGVSAKPCTKCHGSKRIQVKKNISVKVPPGIDSGMRLRVKGKGECGLKGGNNGDMYIQIIVDKNKLFERNGLDLKTIVPIDAITATIGGKIEVQTPWKKVKIDVPSKTSSGNIHVIKSQGIKAGNTVGDFIVEFNVVPFINLNPTQTKLIDDLKKSLNNTNIKGLNEYSNGVKKIFK